MDPTGRTPIDIVELNHTISQLNAMDIFRILQSTPAEYTVLRGSHGTFPNIDPTVVH